MSLIRRGGGRSIERVLENITATMFQLYPPEYMGPVFERYSRALLVPLAVAGEGLDGVSRLVHDTAFYKRCMERLDKKNPSTWR